jgi:hypothetical protein
MAYKIDNSFFLKGKKVEDVFAELINADVRATKEQDIQEHWDVGKGNYKFDVKGLKKISRQDEHFNEDFHWVEVKNVIGRGGWCFSGKANFIVFETFDYFICVKKDNLQELIKEKVVKTYVDSPYDALYGLYQRKGRKDVLTLVKTIDLMAISSKILKK